MIEINLLPPQMRKSEMSFIRFFCLIGFGIFFMFIMSYSYGIYQIASLQGEREKDADAYALLRQSMQRRVELNRISAVIDEKNKILVNLSKSDHSWYAILVHLSMLVPSGVWLDQVHVDTGNRLIIQGYATNYQELALFLRAFEQDTLFIDAVLGSSGMKRENTMDDETIGFKISARSREE